MSELSWITGGSEDVYMLQHGDRLDIATERRQEVCTCKVLNGAEATRMGNQGQHLEVKYRIFRSDAVATIFFAARFVRLLFEGGVHFFGKPGDC